MDLYPTEVLDEDDDDGTMPENVNRLASHVIGRRIVSAERVINDTDRKYGVGPETLVLTLDDGRRVQIADTYDCCAYTELRAFLLHPESVDHMILGVGTTGRYTTWHIYADMGDVLTLTCAWSPGNPYYYAYGFDIDVVEVASNS